MTTIHERIKAQRKRVGMTQVDLAKIVGVARVSLTQWENGDTSPKGENLLKLSRALSVSPDWLVTGKESDAPVPGALPVTVWDDISDLDPAQHVVVPRVNVRFAAGSGHEVTFEPDTHDKGNAYRLDWIRRKGLDPKRLIVVIVDGESMAPSLPHGSAMTTDTRVNTLEQVVDGKVYAIRYGNELRVKRLRRRFDGALLIDSDNPAFPREIVEPHQLEHIGIIGAYVAHSYDGEI